jgi:hypothetical protein
MAQSFCHLHNLLSMLQTNANHPFEHMTATPNKSGVVGRAGGPNAERLKKGTGRRRRQPMGKREPKGAVLRTSTFESGQGEPSMRKPAHRSKSVGTV